MKFHEPFTLWGSRKEMPSVPADKPVEFYHLLAKKMATKADLEAASSEMGTAAVKIGLEGIWFRNERPFYNVYPGIENMLRTVKLDVPLSMIDVPDQTLMLRFGPDSRFKTILAGKLDERLWVVPNVVGRGESYFSLGDGTVEDSEILQEARGEHWKAPKNDGVNVEDHIDRYFKMDNDQIEAIRLVVGLCLLAKSEGFVQPVVLSKDVHKFQSATDEQREVMVQRAIRRNKQRGFTVGKELEKKIAAESVNPHYRNPHLATFWTGKGRTKPVLKIRAGALVKRTKVTEVPTGYLGNGDDE